MKDEVTIIRKKNLQALTEEAKKQPAFSLELFIRNKANFSFVVVTLVWDVLLFLCLTFMWLFPSVFPPLRFNVFHSVLKFKYFFLCVMPKEQLCKFNMPHFFGNSSTAAYYELGSLLFQWALRSSIIILFPDLPA